MKLGRAGYRLAMLVLTLLGLGVAVSASINDSINQFYFHTHNLADSVFLWLGVALATFGVVESLFLVVRSRFD